MRGRGACVMACWSYGGRVVGVCPMGECGRTRCTSESGSCPLPPSPTPCAPRPYHPHDRQHRPHRQRHPLLSVGRRSHVSISASPLTRLLPLPSLVRLSHRRPIHARTTRPAAPRCSATTTSLNAHRSDNQVLVRHKRTVRCERDESVTPEVDRLETHSHSVTHSNGRHTFVHVLK